MQDLRKSYAEVSCILDVLGEKYTSKLPSKFLEYINENKQSNYVLDINEENYETVNISRDAIIIICLLNLKYWIEDENEKQKLIEQYKKNDEKFQEKINSFKNEDWLRMPERKEEFKELKQSDFSEEKALQIIDKNSILDRIKKFIKRLFNKWKE